MRIAITGASGFLGRYLVAHCTSLGHACRGLIRPDSPRNADRPAIDWVVGALDDEAALAALVAGCDALIHAALDHPGGGFQATGLDVTAFVARNVVATVRLIEAARAAKVPRIVVLSSGAVHDVILSDRPLDETHPLWPKSHYGATKAAIEAFVSSYGRGEGLEIAALRPTSIYGLAEPLTASRWYPLIAAVVRGEAVDCQRGAKQVHALDVARATALLLTAPGIAGQVYHCTDLFVAEATVARLAQAAAGTTGAITGTASTARHPINCEKIQGLGMTFGGEALLAATVEQLVRQVSASLPPP